MADPTQNYVPKTASAKMMQDTANDLTIGSAVKGTSSTLYTEFDDLRTNCNSDLVDSTYGGTQGVTPTSFDDFRGYPKPTITMNFETISNGTSPAEIIEDLVCAPTLNNKVGFDIIISVQVIEEIVSVEIPQIHNETFTILEGSTTVSSSTLPSFTGGKWRCNSVYRQWTYPEDITIQVKNITVDVPSYYDATPHSTILEYTAALTVYNHTIETFPNASCGFFGGGTPSTAYSLNSTVNGATLYTDALLTTFVAAGKYATNYVGDFEYDWFSVSSIGVVSGYTVCS